MLNGFEIIDAHCHIYPAKIALKAAEAVEDFYQVSRTMLTYDPTPHALVEAGTAEGIDHFVVHSVATTPHQVHSINRFIAEKVSKYQGKMTGLGTVHPLSEDMEGDVAELVGLGLHGIKIHPDMQGFPVDHPGYLKAFHLCGRYGIPVLTHAGDFRKELSNPARLARVLEACPETIFVGAHFGGWSVWEEALKILPQYQNLYVDSCSTSYAIGYLGMRRCVDAYGPDRVLFATDYPMHLIGNEIREMLYMKYSEEEYRKMFSENARKVYRIGEE